MCQPIYGMRHGHPWVNDLGFFGVCSPAHSRQSVIDVPSTWPTRTIAASIYDGMVKLKSTINGPDIAGGLFKFEFRFNQWAGLICNPEIWKFQIQRCEKRLDIAVASRILPWREFRPNSLPSSLYSFTALNLFPWVSWIQIHLQKSKYLWNF